MLNNKYHNKITISALNSSRLVVSPVRPDQLKPKPHVKDLTFGSTFTDHMLRVKWTAAGGWEAPRITGKTLSFDNYK